MWMYIQFAVLALVGSGGAVSGAVAEQQPITPTIMPAPPPSGPVRANFGAFPVGLWVPASSPCRGFGRFLRVRKDGSYSGDADAGGWRLAAGILILSHAAAPPMATNDMERSAPVVRRRLPLVRAGDTRMTLAGAPWKRCSPDPDLYVK